MTDIIEVLSEKIAGRQCVIFLGPGVFKESPGDEHTIYETFAMDLAAKMEAARYPFDSSQKGNMYYIIPRYLLFKNQGDIQRMNMVDMRGLFAKYSKEKINRNPLFNGSINLPFPIIINTNPDKNVQSWISSPGTTVFSYYDISNQTGAASKVQLLQRDNFSDANNTVIYNLFGSYDNLNSLLLTEDELLEYNIHLNQNDTRIPQVLTSELSENKLYLFLGFQFDQWLLKIVIKALGLPRIKGVTFSIPQCPPPVYQQHFYEDMFKFVFVNEGSAYNFLETLAGGFQPVTSTARKQLKMVILYHRGNHSDLASARSLGFHFKPFKDNKDIWLWSEELLLGDEDIERGILDNLMDADIVVPLISAEMVGECQQQLDWLEQAYNTREKKPSIVSVLLRDYDYSAIPFLKDQPWTPFNNQDKVQAIKQWANEDEAYKKVALKIGELIKAANQ